MTINPQSLIFSKLTEDTDVSSFSCSASEDLQDFLRAAAKDNQRQKISTTYVVHSGTVLVAFFSLSMGCIKSDFVKNKMTVDVNDPPNNYPALLLARIATKDEYQCQGIGREMMKHVFNMAFDLTEQIGCRFVKVDSKKDERTVKFYRTNGSFIKIHENEDTIQMVVDLNKIGKETGDLNDEDRTLKHKSHRD
ncbi:MAG: GNAT family N-acetyltransferase [Methanoregula sp.]